MTTRLESPADRIESFVSTVESVAATTLQGTDRIDIIEITHDAVDVDELVEELSTTEQVYWITQLFEEYGVDTAYITEGLWAPHSWRGAVESMFRDALTSTIARVVTERELDGDDVENCPTATVEKRSYGRNLDVVNVDAIQLAQSLAFEAAGRVALESVSDEWEARYETLEAHREDIWGDLTIVEIAHLIEESGETFGVMEVQETDQFPDCADDWENVLMSGILWHHLDKVMAVLMDDYDRAMMRVGENTATAQE